MKLRLQASADLWRRYAAVFRTAWRVRAELDAPARLSHELAFLPATLELVETPVHPAPRWAMRVIVGLAFVVLAIGVLGRLDIVVAAKGKLIPNARVKIIQPAITGVVRRIDVRDGQRVRAGESLLVLDATQAAADSDKARLALAEAELTVARAQALLDAQVRGRAPLLDAVPDASAADNEAAVRYAQGQYREYQDKLASAQAELEKRKGELASTAYEVQKLEATAPLARQSAEEYKHLSAGQYVAKIDYLQKEQTALEQENVA